MSVTAIEGVVKNGQIHFDGDVQLPEFSRVYVLITNEHLPARIRSPKLVNPADIEQFEKKVEIVDEK